MAGEDLTAIISVVLNDQATAGLQALPAEVEAAVSKVNATLAGLGGGEDPFAKLQAATEGEYIALTTLAQAAGLAKEQLALAAESAVALNSTNPGAFKVTGLAEAQALRAELTAQLRIRQELAATGVAGGVTRTPGGQLRVPGEDGGSTRISQAENERLLAVQQEELTTLRQIGLELERQIGQATALRQVTSGLAAEGRLVRDAQGSGPRITTGNGDPAVLGTRLIKGGASDEQAAQVTGLEIERVRQLRTAYLEAAAAVGGLKEQEALLANQNAARKVEALRAEPISTAGALGGFAGANAGQQAAAQAASLKAQASALQLAITREEITGDEELAAAKQRVILLTRESAAITTALAEAKAAGVSATSAEVEVEGRQAAVRGLLGESSGVLLERTLALAQAEERLARTNTNASASYEQLLGAQRAVLTQTRLLEAATEKQALAAGGSGGFFGGVGQGIGAQGKGGESANSFEVGKQIGEVAKYIYLYEAFIKITEGIKEAVKNTLEFERSVTVLTDLLDTTRDKARGTAESLAAIGAVGGLTPGKSTDLGVQFARTFQGQAAPSTLLQQGAELGTQLSVLTGQDAGKQLQDATATVRGFNLSFADTSRVIDAATYAAQKFGFANASDVLPGLGQIGDIAKASGFSVEQTAALVADVRARTGDTSEAAAGELRRIFGRQGNNAFQQVFQQFGVNRSQGFEQEIAQLAGKYDTLNEKQKAFITSQFGGGRAGTAATAFLEDYGKIVTTASGALDNAGISQKQFAQRLNDVAGIVASLRGEFARLGVLVGETGLGTGFGAALIVLKDLVTTTGDLLSIFNQIPAPIRQAAFFFGELYLAGKAFRALGLQNLVVFGGAGRAAAAEAKVAGAAGAAGGAAATTEVGAAQAAALEAAGANLVAALELVTAELSTAGGAATSEVTAAVAALGEALIALTDEEAARVIEQQAASVAIAEAGAATAAALQATAGAIATAGAQVALAGRAGLAESLTATAATTAVASRTVLPEVAEAGLLARSTAGARAAGSAATGFLSAAFSSPLLVAGAAVILSDLFIKAGNKVKSAATQETAVEAKNAGVITPDNLASQISASAQALQKVQEANSGLIGSIVGFFSSSGDSAKSRAKSYEAFLKDEKKKADDATRALATGSSSSVIDYASAGGVKAGVDSLTQSGRSATTVFGAIVESLQNLNVTATAAAEGGLNILAGKIGEVAGTLAVSVAGSAADAFQNDKSTTGAFSFRASPNGAARRVDRQQLQDVDAGKIGTFLSGAFQRDLESLGVNANGGTLSADQVEQLRSKAVQEFDAGLKNQGKRGLADRSPEQRKLLLAAIKANLDDSLAALRGATDAAKNVVTPENINQVIGDLIKNATAAGAESGTSAALAGTGGAASTAAKAALDFAKTGLGAVTALSQSHPEVVTADQLQQAQNQVNVLTLAYTVSLQTQIDALAKLTESKLAPSDKIGRANLELGAIASKLKIETDPDKINALQTTQNDLLHTQQQNATDLANAVEKSGVDPRNTLGQAQVAVDVAARQVALLKSQGDTSSAAFFDALASLQQAEVGLGNAQVTQANAVIEAGIRSGDSLGEAQAKVQEAANTLAAQAVGTPGYLAALRAYHDAVYAAGQATAAQANAQADASVFPGDAYATAKTKVEDARRDLAATTVGTTDYYKALAQYEQALVAYANEQANAAKTAFLLGSGTFTDPLTQAQASVQAARAKLAADRNGITFRTPDTIIPGTPGTAPTPGSADRVSAAQGSVANDQAIIADLRRQAADIKAVQQSAGVRTDIIAQNAKEYADAIAPYQAQLNTDLAALSAAQKAAQGTPGTSATVIRGVTKTIKASAEQVAADQLALAQALQVARDAAAQLANAKIEAGEGDVASKLDAARNALVEAGNTLRADQFRSTKYFQDLANLHKAQESYAQALRDAARNAFELTGDTTDPVFEATVALREAQRKLSDDRKRKAAPDTIAADKLSVEKAQQSAQKAAFDQQFADQKTAVDLGQESQKQYLAYLSGQDASLRRQLSAMKKGSEGYRQLVDELNQVDAAIKATSTALSGQFNLGDIKLPTVYEVRRSLAASQNGGSIVDASVSNIYTTINGADFQAVVNYLNGILGTGGITVATTGRKT